MDLDSFDNYNEANIENIRKHLEQELLDDKPHQSFRMMEHCSQIEVNISETSRKICAEILIR